jgi:hypothetical protein
VTARPDGALTPPSLEVLRGEVSREELGALAVALFALLTAGSPTVGPVAPAGWRTPAHLPARSWRSA